jgi:hypothetical protein
VRKKLGVGFRVLLALAALVLAVVQSLIVTSRVHWSPWAAVAAAGGLGLLGFQLSPHMARELATPTAEQLENGSGKHNEPHDVLRTSRPPRRSCRGSRCHLLRRYFVRSQSRLQIRYTCWSTFSIMMPKASRSWAHSPSPPSAPVSTTSLRRHCSSNTKFCRSSPASRN